MLLEYLVSFCARIKPLLDLSSELIKVKVAFEEKWEAVEFPGWGKEAGSAMAHTGAHLDLSPFSSPEVNLNHIFCYDFRKATVNLKKRIHTNQYAVFFTKFVVIEFLTNKTI